MFTGSNGEELATQPRCPRCESTDGALGTQNGYFMCNECRKAGRPGEVYWTPDHGHPGDWSIAVATSPHGHDGKHGVGCKRCGVAVKERQDRNG